MSSRAAGARRASLVAGAAAALAGGVLALAGADGDSATGLPFRDTFRPRPDAGWRWIREDPKAWRIGEGGLEVRIQPGNNWGPPNDAKNVLVRPAPDPAKQPLQITAAIRNKPSGQWEQVDLCWYYDDSNMVKLGQEMVDGQLSVVMGREQNDRTRTIKIVPIESDSVDLRLVVSGNTVHGKFKTPQADWRDVGECDVPPAPQGNKAQVSLQFYQGLPDVEHWARVSELTIRTGDK